MHASMPDMKDILESMRILWSYIHIYMRICLVSKITKALDVHVCARCCLCLFVLKIGTDFAPRMGLVEIPPEQFMFGKMFEYASILDCFLLRKVGMYPGWGLRGIHERGPAICFFPLIAMNRGMPMLGI